MWFVESIDLVVFRGEVAGVGRDVGGGLCIFIGRGGGAGVNRCIDGGVVSGGGGVV